jgi:glutathionyl-hydroquinone reductase
MGLLVEGIWRDEQPGERTPHGRFVRPATRFRNWVTPDGSAGPTGEAGFPAARDLTISTWRFPAPGRIAP